MFAARSPAYHAAMESREASYKWRADECWTAGSSPSVCSPRVIRKALQAAGAIAAEALWPTRCALCEAPGAVLCRSCCLRLPYMDMWRACPRCGSAYGLVQCCMCNHAVLERMGRTEVPFTACASATMFDDFTGRIVRIYKDQGERRLAEVMADCMVRCLPLGWDFNAVSFVPATRNALNRRGFDHAELLAGHVAQRLRMPLMDALARPCALDQRALSRRQRLANMDGRFSAASPQAAGMRILLVDDVLTTGATIMEASDALLTGQASCVYCMTFARV